MNSSKRPCSKREKVRAENQTSDSSNRSQSGGSGRASKAGNKQQRNGKAVQAVDGIKGPMQDLLKRIERQRAAAKSASSDGRETSLSTRESPSPSKISDEGCEECNYTGTITKIEWAKDSSYPIPYQKTTVKNCGCRQERQFQKYNAADQLKKGEQEHLFATAIIDRDNAAQFTAAKKFIDEIETHLKTGTWLYIFGDEARAEKISREQNRSFEAYGTGKTYLLHCIANALSYRRIPALYVTEEDLFGDIKSTYSRDSDESETEVLNRYYGVPVLMIDDIFTAQYKDWAEGKLFSILDERDRDGKVTIMTSNYATGRIRNRLPMNGGKIASRITGKAVMIEMIGPDRREHGRNR